MNANSLDVLSAVSSPADSDPFCAHLQLTPREIRKHLSEYPDALYSDSFSASTPKHGVFHNLPTAPGSPVFAKAHCLDPEKLASDKVEFLKMEIAGIVQCSTSTWSSPLHMVPKPDGTWRPCGDVEKFVFTASQVEYLGHLVSSSGYAPLHKHLSAITDFPPPADPLPCSGS